MRGSQGEPLLAHGARGKRRSEQRRRSVRLGEVRAVTHVELCAEQRQQQPPQHRALATQRLGHEARRVGHAQSPGLLQALTNRGRQACRRGNVRGRPRCGANARLLATAYRGRRQDAVGQVPQRQLGSVDRSGRAVAGTVTASG